MQKEAKARIKINSLLQDSGCYFEVGKNGRMNPTLSTLEKIANALGISSSELLK